MPSHPLLYFTLILSVCQAFLAILSACVFRSIYLSLYVSFISSSSRQCGNVELSLYPFIFLVFTVFFVWITMWITCGYAVDNFLSGSKSVFCSRVSAVKTEYQKTCFLGRLLTARLLAIHAVFAVEHFWCSAVNCNKA